MRLGLLHTGIRGDEKLIISAAKTHGVELDLIDARTVRLDPKNIEDWKKYDCILERCVSSLRGNTIIQFLDDVGVKVVNNAQVMGICNDKFRTTSVLTAAGLPVVKSILVFTEEQAKLAVEDLGGYPVVLKSREGSWGRLMAKVNEEDSLEGIVAHREFMELQHQAFIVQEYVNKPGRDIRAFVIAGKVIAAIYRNSPHWITNTARGGKAENCPITAELLDICSRASQAVGGGVLAFDLFETDNGLVINEINHTMEFKNSEVPTGVSISGEIVKFCITQAENGA